MATHDDKGYGQFSWFSASTALTLEAVERYLTRGGGRPAAAGRHCALLCKKMEEGGGSKLEALLCKTRNTVEKIQRRDKVRRCG
jgi:hypothetical protein